MPKWSLPLLFLIGGVPGLWAQTPPDAVAIANLREDVRGLSQQVADLSLRVEQLENHQDAAAKVNAGAVTPAQLQQAVADLTAQIDKLRASIATLSTAAAASPSPASVPAAAAPAEHKSPSSFSSDFSKTGTIYVVEKGDTVASIAKKNHAKFQDIVNANRLADPSHIQVGQKLFIPGGK